MENENGHELDGKIRTVCGFTDTQRPEPFAQVPGSAMSLRAVTLKVQLTACKFTMFDAREALAEQLRSIADRLEEDPDTTDVCGNCFEWADYGSWGINDPWETESPNDKMSGRGEVQNG